MNKICRESEASLDYYSLFKAIMKRAVVPMSPLESLASSAVRTAHKVSHHPPYPGGSATPACIFLSCNITERMRSLLLTASGGVPRLQVHASLIVVLTRGGSTARLVAKYRPAIPVLTVAVPVLTTDSLTWTCSGEQPARQCLITRGLLPLLAQGSTRATDSDTTDEILLVRTGCRSMHICILHLHVGSQQRIALPVRMAAANHEILHVVSGCTKGSSLALPCWCDELLHAMGSARVMLPCNDAALHGFSCQSGHASCPISISDAAACSYRQRLTWRRRCSTAPSGTPLLRCIALAMRPLSRSLMSSSQ